MTNEHAYPHDFGMEPCKGLTKREYFAALILANMWSNLERATALEMVGEDPAERWSRAAVRAADALMEELGI